MCARLEGGLKKIAEAQVQLDNLNVKLVVQKVVVKEKSEACEVMLVDITENKRIAEEKQEESETEAVMIEEQQKIIAIEKKDAEESLAETLLPALKQPVKLLKTWIKWM